MDQLVELFWIRDTLPLSEKKKKSPACKPISLAYRIECGWTACWTKDLDAIPAVWGNRSCPCYQVFHLSYCSSNAFWDHEWRHSGVFMSWPNKWQKWQESPKYLWYFTANFYNGRIKKFCVNLHLNLTSISLCCRGKNISIIVMEDQKALESLPVLLSINQQKKSNFKCKIPQILFLTRSTDLHRICS